MNPLEQNQKRVNLIFRECDTWRLLATALQRPRPEILQQIKDSDLRGRGGAGFPTGLKWEAAAAASGDLKYVICNADEGEPGTFKDREILTQQAAKVLAGMALCARVIDATRGYIYLRAEYGYLRRGLETLIDEFHHRLRDSGLDFSVSVRSGSGAYVCGEETALFESMGGNRGEPRNKPPYPVTRGYLDRPTVINNVETFVYAIMIMEIGAEEFKKMGTRYSRGAKMFCVSGDTPTPGIYELEMGMTLSDFVEWFGDGHTKAVQVGGSSGFCVPRRKFAETILGFEGVPTGGSMMLFNSSRSMYNVLHNFLEFFCEESCGQCTPCRVGCQQLLEGIELIKRKAKPRAYLKELQDLALAMRITAKCGLGQSVANSFMSITEHFVEEIYF